jgi:hypothetical protein
VISLLHDASDLIVDVAKCLGQTTLDFLTIPAFLLMMATWFYLRNLMLPYCTYHVWTQGKNQNLFDEYDLARPIYCYLLSLLVILHYYWFSIFVKMLIGVVSDGSTEDQQNVIKSHKKEEKKRT